MHRGTCLQVKGKLYPVDVYSVGPLRNNEGGAQADSANGRRGRKQRRAGTQGLAATSGPAALSGSRTRSTDTISKIKFKQMVGRQNEIQQVGCCMWSRDWLLVNAAVMSLVMLPVVIQDCHVEVKCRGSGQCVLLQ